MLASLEARPRREEQRKAGLERTLLWGPQAHAAYVKRLRERIGHNAKRPAYILAELRAGCRVSRPDGHNRRFSLRTPRVANRWPIRAQRTLDKPFTTVSLYRRRLSASRRETITGGLFSPMHDLVSCPHRTRLT